MNAKIVHSHFLAGFFDFLDLHESASALVEIWTWPAAPHNIEHCRQRLGMPGTLFTGVLRTFSRGQIRPEMHQTKVHGKTVL